MRDNWHRERICALHRVVAPAPNRPKPDRVDNRDGFAVVPDDSVLLERVEERGDLGIFDAHRTREKPSLQLEAHAPNSIVHAEQPPAAALFGGMQPVTGNRLNRRFQKRVAITVEELTQGGTARELVFEQHDRQVLHASITYLDVRVLPVVKLSGQHRQSYDAFAADTRHL